MRTEEDDRDLLRLYRAQAQELPGAALDARILAASRAAGMRRWLLALLPAAAVAACLILALQPARHMPATHTFSTADTAGLYDGQAAQQLADPELMRQMAITQLPGGTNGGTANGS